MKFNFFKPNLKGKNSSKTGDNLLQELVQGYCKLVSISEPSSTELHQIEQILELAVYDKELSDLIDKADEQIAGAMGLLTSQVSPQPQEKSGERLVKLLGWFKGNFEPEWQPIELLTANSGGLRVRSFTTVSETDEIKYTSNRIRVLRGKKISFRSGDLQHTIVFVVEVAKKIENVDICLSLYPPKNINYLPSGLQLTVMDESDSSEPFIKDIVRAFDKQKKLEFNAKLQEMFSVQLAFKDICMTEQFIVSE